MEVNIKREAIFIGCGLIGGTLLGFVLSYQYHGARLETAADRLALLSRLEEEHAAQQQQLVNLETADRINKLAEEKLRQRLNEMQTERIKLESELYVYKKLLEDDETDTGLSLESLLIRGVEGDERRFSYDIVLRRTAALEQSVEARLSVDIEGELHGIPYSLPLKEADPALHEDALALSLRYFKVVKGELVLPEHFEPRTVIMSVYEAGRADSLVIKEMAWSPITY